MARRRRTTFKRAEDSVGFMLWRASNLLQRLHGGCLRSLDVTPTQFSLMTCLMYLQDEGDVTASRIVAHTGMDKMMVSDVLKTLTQKRLVAKERHPRDARASILRPTRRGKAITNAAVRRIEALDDEFFRPVRNVGALHNALIALVAGTGDS